MAYDAGIMRFMRGIVLCGCCSLLAQTAPEGSLPADRASRLMSQADKLAEQRTGKAMEEAIGRYREAIPLWRDVHDTTGVAKALNQIGVLNLRMGVALRRAKLHLMRDPLRASPYYWAGFMLEGDWR